MDARIWVSAKHLLADVVDLPPAERRAYIEAHCTDATLRREIVTAAPLFPLLLTAFSAEDLLMRLVSVVF
jgi:hypothetical protein